jgi:hypothetical protein
MKKSSVVDSNVTVAKKDGMIVPMWSIIAFFLLSLIILKAFIYSKEDDQD